MPRNDINLPRSDTGVSPPGPQAVGVLLMPEFSLLAYACAIEPLRAANRLSGATLYAWRHISSDGAPVAASNGVEIRPDHGLDPDIPIAMLLVCASGNPSVFRDKPVLRWLRALAHRGVRLVGVSGGPYLLARAGLLNGRRATIHWEHFPAFVEDFPEVHATRSLFVVDGDRLTCSGGTAALDMMHALIELDHGHELAAAVSDWFLLTQVRIGSGPQRMSLRERLDVSNPRLLRAVEYMEAHLREPGSRSRLAREAGVSVRQLERLFADQLGSTIGAHYLRIRLDRARILLRQTTLPVVTVAVETGFASASHFSRAYRHAFGRTPREDREAAAALRPGAAAQPPRSPRPARGSKTEGADARFDSRIRIGTGAADRRRGRPATPRR